MNRKEVYIETKNYLKKSWINIFSMTLIIALIGIVLDLMLGAGNGSVNDVMGNTESVNMVNGLVNRENVTLFDFVAGLIMTFINILLSSGLAITVYKKYSSHEKIRFSEVLANAKKYLVPVAVISAIIAIVQSFLDLIPLVGPILYFIIGLMIAFTDMILADDETASGVEALKLSIHRSTGYKMDFFFVQMYYILRSLIGLVLMFIGYMLVVSDLAIGAVFVLVGTITLFVLTLYYAPFLIVSTIVFYNNMKLQNNNYQ